MTRFLSLAALLLVAGILFGQSKALNPVPQTPRPIEALDSVWIEELTWMEVRDALQAGKTTVIVPTGGIPDAALEGRLVAATQGKLTNLKGGFPIVVDGKVIGAIGVGSGTGEQDIDVALAGLAALSGAKTAF